MADFSTTPHGLLPTGTQTPHGTIVRSTLTAYEMDDGAYVPFATVHGPYGPEEPMVIFG